MNLIKKAFNWFFKAELDKLNSEITTANYTLNKLKQQQEKFEELLMGIDVSVDVHDYKYSPSWAVISLQGKHTDYIKFVDLGDSDIREISKFLRNFEKDANIKIDAYPTTSDFLKITHKNKELKR